MNAPVEDQNTDNHLGVEAERATDQGVDVPVIQIAPWFTPPDGEQLAEQDPENSGGIVFEGAQSVEVAETASLDTPGSSHHCGGSKFASFE